MLHPVLTVGFAQLELGEGKGLAGYGEDHFLPGRSRLVQPNDRTGQNDSQQGSRHLADDGEKQQEEIRRSLQLQQLPPGVWKVAQNGDFRWFGRMGGIHGINSLSEMAPFYQKAPRLGWFLHQMSAGAHEMHVLSDQGQEYLGGKNARLVLQIQKTAVPVGQYLHALQP